MTTPSAQEALVAAAYQALRDVWDPELGLDIVSMGLIYDVRADETGVVIDMTLTTPGCPVSQQLPMEAEETLRRALPEVLIQLNVVWDPPWSPERMSDDVLGALKFR
ncbi:MAG TPA: iron-sulfur cluster assembly protein [Acidimicrobiia bacterium]|nr:iron-sulfur cluster assembly protein [Acidimicrobiia bacterium]